MTWQYDGTNSIKDLIAVTKQTNEKIDDLIAAVLTLAEEHQTHNYSHPPSVDSIFAQKREMLKNRE